MAGHEPFSVNNCLTQNVFQILDNVNIYLNKHTLTLGANLERVNVDDSFNLGAYPGVVGPEYACVTDFVTAAKGADFAKSVTDAKATFAAGNWALAQTSVGQLGVYAQVEYVVDPRLTLTFGLKIDFRY